MPLIPEVFLPEDEIKSICEMLPEGAPTHVREHPLQVFRVLRRPEGGWSPALERHGLVFVLLDEESQDDRIALAMYSPEREEVEMVNGEGVGDALVAALSWAEGRRAECRVRLLLPEGKAGMFWCKADGPDEAFFPFTGGRLTTGGFRAFLGAAP